MGWGGFCGRGFVDGVSLSHVFVSPKLLQWLLVGWCCWLVFVVWVVCLRFVGVYWLVLCCLVNVWCDVCLLVGVIVLCWLFVDCLVCLRCFCLIVLFRVCLDLYMVVWFWLCCRLGLLCWVFGFIVICLFTWLLHSCWFWLVFVFVYFVVLFVVCFVTGL